MRLGYVLRWAVTTLFVIWLGLFALGHLPTTKKQSPPSSRVSGGPIIRSISVLTEIKDRTIEKEIVRVRVPSHFRRAGEQYWTPFSVHQQEVYRILAIFFRDKPVMLAIAGCESGFMHERPDGRLNVGPDGFDWGAFMIRELVHGRELRQLGLNAADFIHNVAFATYLMSRDGLRPWNSSKHCWGHPEGLQYKFPSDA